MGTLIRNSYITVSESLIAFTGGLWEGLKAIWEAVRDPWTWAMVALIAAEIFILWMLTQFG